MPLHPLVKQAAKSFDTKERVIVSLKAQSNGVPAGRYEFAIYQWRFQGIRDDLMLKPIASSEALTPHLSHLLEKAVDADDQNESNATVWDELDAHHYKLWSKERTDHQQRNQELAKYRTESLSTSHQARMALLVEQFAQANDEKIQRMRQSQIKSATADYNRRIQELDNAMEKADVIAEPVAYGILTIEEI